MPDPVELPSHFSDDWVQDQVPLPTQYRDDTVRKVSRFQLYNELADLAARAAVGALSVVGLIVLLMIAKGSASKDVKSVLESLQPFVLPLIGALAGYAIAAGDGGTGSSG